MPQIRPIPALTYPYGPQIGCDLSAKIAPPYDVLDASSKAKLLSQDPHNIVAVDLPHLPPKTVGPDAVYQGAGEMYRQWVNEGVLRRGGRPALFAYQQTFEAPGSGRVLRRRGLFANVTLQPFGPAPDGRGGVHPHEQTFSAPKEDRLKLMRATAAQLSPIFGLYGDDAGQVRKLLDQVIDAGPADFTGSTLIDGVRHEVWVVDAPQGVKPFVDAMAGADIFIADGHHRYTTALNYRDELVQRQGALPAEHPANFCLFVLVALEDAGLIVLPTHRVLGGMSRFTFAAFVTAAQGALKIEPFAGKDLAALEAALPEAGPHAIGLYNPANPKSPLAIATTVEADPLALTFPKRAPAWRQLDVAIVQHLIVERICQPHFCDAGQSVQWRFPHTLEDLKAEAHIPGGQGGQLGLVLQPTPLEAIRQVSAARELMPQKSTFFYPKLATGLVISPVDR